jgi:16S rRNA (guanine527-N7)-methyltransferase
VADEPGVVSRETSPEHKAEPPYVEREPHSAVVVFGEHLPLARQFAADLAHYGDVLGLIGPLERGRLWSRHVVNCALVGPLLKTAARVADVGSGAGLPGLVLALVRPDVSFTLIEPMQRRADWLRDEVSRLGITNVVVLRARAEEAVEAGPFDVVTARAVSALTKLIPITVPLAREGGELLFLKGERVADEVMAAATVIRRYRVSNVEVCELGAGVVPEVTRLFRATVGGASRGVGGFDGDAVT